MTKHSLFIIRIHITEMSILVLCTAHICLSLWIFYRIIKCEDFPEPPVIIIQIGIWKTRSVHEYSAVGKARLQPFHLLLLGRLYTSSQNASNSIIIFSFPSLRVTWAVVHTRLSAYTYIHICISIYVYVCMYAMPWLGFECFVALIDE